MSRLLRADPTTIKQRLGIADVLRAHGLTVRAGRMACPIHAGGNRSSFSIKPGDRYARCWACGWHGDVIALEHALGGGTVGDAIQRCAALAGLRAPRPWERKPWLERQQKQAEARAVVRAHVEADWRQAHAEVLRDEMDAAWHERQWAREHLDRHPEEPALWAWLAVACAAYDAAEWAVERAHHTATRRRCEEAA